MQDTNTNVSQQPASLRERTTSALAQAAGAHARKSSASAPPAKMPGMIQRLRGFFAALFARVARQERAPDPTVAERAATALAAQMPPPMAFKGDSASTLVTPIGAYAGKPVDQALRKRAEQQFIAMDISNATMN